MGQSTNPKTVGLTGGIGVGKSFCAKLFKELGIPIYSSDERAKALMVTDIKVISQIKAVFGDAAYHKDGALNRKHIADKIFTDKGLRTAINSIVHPAVRSDFLSWVSVHNTAPYVMQESALLFEIGLHKQFDAIVLVDAPLDVRISRVVTRDNTSVEAVQHRINSQMPSEEKRQLADYIIDNDGQQGLVKQVLEVYWKLIGQ